MKIVKLQAENVKRLKVVEITPSGSVVTIKGENGQGKTSLLDSIQLALGGKAFAPPKVIRDGQDHAQVVVDLGEIIVDRRWTPKGTYLEVRSREGAKFPSPQAMLDKLVGTLSFDPLAFMRFEPRKQAETLRALVGLDFTELDRKRTATFEARTLVNREVSRLKALLDGAPTPPPGIPAEEVSIADLLAEQQRLLAQKAENERIRRQVIDAARTVEACGTRLREAQFRVEELKEQLADAEQFVVICEGRSETAAKEYGALDMKADGLTDLDVAEVGERIRTVTETNAAIRRAKERARLVETHRKAVDNAEELSAQIATVDLEKQAHLAAAKFPVEGLSFGDEGITFNGIPLEQASAAEQLRVSLAMGLALNPKLKVVLIRDASLLDSKSLALVGEMAAAAGAQVWLEMVGTAGAVGVVIEDGEAFGPEAQVSVGESAA